MLGWRRAPAGQQEVGLDGLWGSLLIPMTLSLAPFLCFGSLWREGKRELGVGGRGEGQQAPCLLCLERACIASWKRRRLLCALKARSRAAWGRAAAGGGGGCSPARSLLSRGGKESCFHRKEEGLGRPPAEAGEAGVLLPGRSPFPAAGGEDAGGRLGGGGEGGPAGEAERRLAAALEEEALPADRGGAAAAAGQGGPLPGGAPLAPSAGQGAALLGHEDGGLRGAQGQVRLLHGGDGAGQGDRLPRAPGAGLERRDRPPPGPPQEPPGRAGRPLREAEAAAPAPPAAAAAAAEPGPRGPRTAPGPPGTGAPQAPQRLQPRLARPLPRSNSRGTAGSKRDPVSVDHKLGKQKDQRHTEEHPLSHWNLLHSGADHN